MNKVTRKKTKYPKKLAKDEVEKWVYQMLRMLETSIYRIDVLTNTEGISEKDKALLKDHLVLLYRLKLLMEASLEKIRLEAGPTIKELLYNVLSEQNLELTRKWITDHPELNIKF